MSLKPPTGGSEMQPMAMEQDSLKPPTESLEAAQEDSLKPPTSSVESADSLKPPTNF